jgi:hypothetical protein
MMVTEKQLKEMRHALGIDENTAKGIQYRNYFCTYGEDASWEELVNLGLATKHKFPKGLLPENGLDYCLTDKGIAVARGKNGI